MRAAESPPRVACDRGHDELGVEAPGGRAHAAAHPLDLTPAGESSAADVARIEKSGGEPGEKTTPAVPLVSLDSGEGHEMTLSWRGALPDPTVHGTARIRHRRRHVSHPPPRNVMGSMELDDLEASLATFDSAGSTFAIVSILMNNPLNLLEVEATDGLRIVLEKLGEGSDYRIMISGFTYDEVPAEKALPFVTAVLTGRARIRKSGRALPAVWLTVSVQDEAWEESRSARRGLEHWEALLMGKE